MASKKTGAKKSAKKSINKSAFVRELPASMPAKEVVEKAKAAGIALTDKHVYAIRSKEKSDAAASARTSAAPSAAAAPSAEAKTGGTKRGRPPGSGKARGAGGGKSKADFVRSLPSNTPAKEVVAKAKASGISLTPAYVYNIRASSAKAAGGAPKRRGRPVGSGKRPTVAATGGGGGGGGGSHEATFRRLILTLGIERSKRLVDDVDRKLSALIAGV